MPEQPWDPFETLRRTLWIGGAQWAGKSTVARILAQRHGVTAYHYDYHDARGHQDRRIARRVALGEPAENPSPDAAWVDATAESMAAATLDGFPVRFEWALDDCAACTRRVRSSPRAGDCARSWSRRCWTRRAG
jgi:hypothetical protein